MTFVTYYTTEELNGEKIMNIIREIYENDIVKHIGYTPDSFVYHLPVNNKVIKCFSKNRDEIDYEYILNLELLVYKDNEEKLSLCKPEDVFYIQPDNLNKIWCCFVFPYYKYDLERYNIKSCSFSTKLVFIDQLIKGINQLQKLGYYHGDLKLKNICIQIHNETKEEELKIIDFGCSSKLNMDKNKYVLKNTTWYASPIQLFNHIKSFINNCECTKRKTVMCHSCRTETFYKGKLMQVLKDKYNVKIIKGYWYNTEDESEDDSEEEMIEEDCIQNDNFGVAIVIYYILTGEHFMSCSSVHNLVIEMIDFLNHPEMFITSKIGKFKFQQHEIDIITQKFKKLIMEYLNNIGKR